MQVKTLAIVGVGLIGAAIGLTARRKRIAERIVGYDRNVDHLQKGLDCGAIDEAKAEISAVASEADILVCCVPVDHIAEQVLLAAKFCRPGSLLTDAGSTKTKIVAKVEEYLPFDLKFVGGHPLAGSEKQGPEWAPAHLFEGKTTVLTRTSKTSEEALLRVKGFWEALGTKVVIMSPEEHDQAMAFSSHLPHLASSAVAGILPNEFKALVASGFRDVTRIASGDPKLWAAIFSHNRENVLEALGKLTERLQQLQKTLEASDWTSMAEQLDQAKKVRDALGN
jgi:cyclohexadieny/prephenate dehydrogenase